MKHREVMRTAAAFGWLLLAAAASGQVRQVELGGALDANPMVGGQGSNAVPEQRRAINSQLYVTGQVTGLAGFQGNVPYFAPNQLHLALPGQALSNFIGRSVGVMDVLRGTANVSAPYYSATDTVFGVGGILRGRTAPGTDVPAADLPVYYDTNRLKLYNEALKGYAAYSPLSVQIEVPPPQPLIFRDTAEGLIGTTNPGLAAMAERWYGVPTAASLGLFSMPAGEGRRELERQLYADRQRRELQEGSVLRENAGPLGPVGTEQTETKVTPPFATRPLAEEPKAVAPAGGDDMFMQLLMHMKEAREAAPAPPGARAGITTMPAATPTAPSGANVLIRSLAGEARGSFGAEMARGERTLRLGRYYEAAALFDTASLRRPDNPLPLVGSAISLLAAGEPLSAAQKLRQAMQVFPPIMETRFDLNHMLGRRVFQTATQEAEAAAGRSTPRVAGLLNFLAAFLSRNAGDLAKARSYAEKAKAAGEDSVLAAYAEVLAGQSAAAPAPLSPKAR